MEGHRAAVRAISAAVKALHAARTPFRISHGSTNSTRPRAAGAHIVDTGALRHVLHVDADARTALVEPNVPMDRLVDTTLKYGLVPPVVMEFPGITVGGGYAGTSGESSSFRHGFFNETLNSVEMVLADGEVVTASPAHRPDLFWGAAGACGTLGIATLVELRLVRACRYVKTTYHPVRGATEAVATIQRMRLDDGGGDLDYLDGILFSEDCGAVVAGRLTDEEPPNGESVRTFTNARDPWFYLHVHSLVSPGTRTGGDGPSQPVTEYIPLFDYLFRYDRGGFWVGRSAFEYFSVGLPGWLSSMFSLQTSSSQSPSTTAARAAPRLPLVPFNRATRWALDDFLRTRMLYSALHASGQSDNYIVQDLALPYDKAQEFVEWCAAHTGIWPLWLCPLRAPRTAPVVTREEGRLEGTIHPHTPQWPRLQSSSQSSSSKQSPAYEPTLNIGLWGTPPPAVLGGASTASKDGQKKFHDGRGEALVRLNRALEAILRELGGMKWLYAHTFYTRAEFWGVYDKRWYAALRRKYNAEGLPDVHDKVARLPAGWDVERERLATGADSRDSDRTLTHRILDTWPLAGLYGIWRGIRGGEYKKARRRHWDDIDLTAQYRREKAS